MLYLHEIIDIVGTGQESYLATVGERARHSEQQGISRLVGTWKVIGSTNRWPGVVNLWEMDSWEHWAEVLERQFLAGKTDPALAPWWAKATQWRSGGFDRILEPAPYSPTRDALRQRGLRASVCTHTLVQLLPGLGGRYLEARSLTLLGAYGAPMRPDEVLLLWAAPNFRHLTTLCARRRSDAELERWTERVTPWRREADTMWLVPSTECFFAAV